MDINRATLSGNITREPEHKTTPNGQSITTFSIATNRKWTDPQTKELKENVEFHNCVAWGFVAEAAATIQKGQHVHVEGRLQTRSWETPEGKKQYRTEIVVDSLNTRVYAPKAPTAEGEDSPM